MLDIEQVMNGKPQANEQAAPLSQRLADRIEAHKLKRAEHIAEATRLEAKAKAERAKASNRADFDDLRAEAESERREALASLASGLKEWANSKMESPVFNMGVTQAIGYIDSHYTGKQPLSFDTACGIMSGRGAHLLVLMAAGVVENTLPDLVTELDKLPPFKLYALANACGVLSDEVSDAQEAAKTLELINAQGIVAPVSYGFDPSVRGRFVHDLSHEDFLLVFGAEGENRMRSYKASKDSGLLADNEAFQAIKSATDYKIWQARNALPA